jgi:hypothetical protein
MLTVVFASGASTRVPFNPGQTVHELIESVRVHDAAAEPAPGRERAFLAAAVASATMATARGVVDTNATVGGGSAKTTAQATEGLSTATTSPTTGDLSDAKALLIGRAFVDEPPFPPRRLPNEATLEHCRIPSDGRVLVVFLAPQVLRDPTRVTGASLTPSRCTKCTDVRQPFGGLKSDYVVHCENKCGRTGQIYGGAGGIYTKDSNVCLAALHAGVLQVGAAGYFTVRTCGSRPGFPSTVRNGVTTTAYNSAYGAVTVTAYLPGDEFALTSRD